MADHTSIEWTDATWNPVTGCSVVSPACTNCYAMKLAGTRLKHHPSRTGLTQASKAGPVWNGQVRFNEQWLDQPLHWKRPRRIFVCAHGDLFHEDVPDEWIDRVFAVMALAPQHTFQVLTKRSNRMREYLTRRCGQPISPLEGEMSGRTEGGAQGAGVARPSAMAPGVPRSESQTVGFRPPPATARHPLSNVWLGVSVEDQIRADERIPDLLATPAAVRFVSAEPLLGPIDFNDIPWPTDRPRFPETDDISDGRSALRMIDGARLDWVIVGGESGPNARPMHPQWTRDLRDQCAAAGAAFHFKQWGAWSPGDDLGEDVLDGAPFGAFMAISGSRPGAVWCANISQDIAAANEIMFRVGKKRAGRLLDGVEHNGFPGVCAT